MPTGNYGPERRGQFAPYLNATVTRKNASTLSIPREIRPDSWKFGMNETTIPVTIATAIDWKGKRSNRSRSNSRCIPPQTPAASPLIAGA